MSHIRGVCTLLRLAGAPSFVSTSLPGVVLVTRVSQTASAGPALMHTPVATVLSRWVTSSGSQQRLCSNAVTAWRTRRPHGGSEERASHVNLRQALSVWDAGKVTPWRGRGVHRLALPPGRRRRKLSREASSNPESRPGEEGAASQQTQQHTTTHTNASLPDAGMPPRKGKGGGRIRRAFARAKSRARVAAQSAKERVKQAPRNIGELIKVYGRTALLTYIAVDVCTLSLSFMAVKYGIDVEALFHYLGLPFELTDISGGPLVSMFVVALALNKLTIPVRLAVTGAVVPTVAKRLRRRFPDFSQKWLGLGPKTKPPLNM